MHHVAFAPHALHILISIHIYTYAIDHVEPEFQVEQVHRVFEGP
jgi:hypothetical protein